MFLSNRKFKLIIQPIPQSTVDALKTAADGIKASADAIDAAINPPAPTS
jgi:hypothetical protein